MLPLAAAAATAAVVAAVVAAAAAAAAAVVHPDPRRHCSTSADAPTHPFLPCWCTTFKDTAATFAETKSANSPPPF